MPKSGDIYTATEAVQDLAITAFKGIENDDDLTQLVADLGALIDRAAEVRDVVVDVNASLGKLW